MKWKIVYGLSLTVVVSFVAFNIALNFLPHIKENSVVVKYDTVPGTAVAVYDSFSHEITIKPELKFKKYVFNSLAHELKHANNNQQFPYFLNTDANEMSAKMAEVLVDYGLQNRMQHALVKMPPSDLKSPMDKLQEKRFKAGTDWNVARQSLRAEKQRLIDFITMRFACNTRDSLLRLVNEKYDEESASTKKLKQIAQNITDGVSYKINLAAIEHDMNYNLPVLEQQHIDNIFSKALAKYKSVRAKYLPERMMTWLVTQFHPLNDSELEKLFTYKINGVHRSLFKEASPEIQA